MSDHARIGVALKGCAAIVRRISTGLIVRLNILFQAVGLIGPADVYLECADDLYYPSYLIRALRLAGTKTVEVPRRDARPMLRIDGLANFLRRVRVIPTASPPSARTIIVRDSDRLHAPSDYESYQSLVRVSFDYFSEDTRAAGIVMPYFIQPGLWRFKREFERVNVDARPFRVGFAGTIHDEAYSKDFVFPMMNRKEIFDTIYFHFDRQIARVNAPSDLEDGVTKRAPIIIVSVNKTGDNPAKHILRGRRYIHFLKRCSFFIAPPGWVMPYSHNLIESMAAGAIPILNYASYLDPPLVDGLNCLSFATPTDLRSAIERAIAMSEDDIARLRLGVLRYFAQHLSVDAFARRIRPHLSRDMVLVVNREHTSAALWLSRRSTVPVSSESNP